MIIWDYFLAKLHLSLLVSPKETLTKQDWSSKRGHVSPLVDYKREHPTKPLVSLLDLLNQSVSLSQVRLCQSNRQIPTQTSQTAEFFLKVFSQTVTKRQYKSDRVSTSELRKALLFKQPALPCLSSILWI
jgi:hypothetical protein